MVDATPNSNSSESQPKESHLRCRRCILSPTTPGVQIDSSTGLCAECEEFERLGEPSTYASQMSLSDMSLQLDRYRTPRSRYSCLVLFTGGKDSTYLLKLLSSLEDFRVLALTVDCWFTSPETEANIKHVLKELSVDQIMFRPAWGTSSALYQEIIPLAGELCMPCEAFITTEAYRMAIEMQIPSIAWGLNQTQFNTVPDWIVETDLAYWEKIKSRFIEEMGVVLGPDSEAFKEFREKYVLDLAPNRDLLPQHVFPFLALGYDPVLAEREVEKIGWRYPSDVSGVGSNCSAHHLHMYLKKAFYSRESLERYLALEVRKGAIARDRALNALETPVPEELANQVLSSVGLSMSAPELAENSVWIRRCMC